MMSGKSPPASSASPISPDQKRTNSATATPVDKEDAALDEAVRSGQHEPEKLIRNLQRFLVQFPQTTRREQVLQAIFKQALLANDTAAAKDTAEKLLVIHPEDPTLLTTMVNLLDRQQDAPSRAAAAHYATRFIEYAVKKAAAPPPADDSTEEAAPSNSIMLASAYLMRGKIYAKSGDNDRAVADYGESYKAYPTARVAELIGDSWAQRGNSDAAMDYYALAFAFPEESSDPAHRHALRKKIGALYVAKYKSEKGLGDFILARYDMLNDSLRSRFATSENHNSGRHDPFDFVLEKLDGSPLPLANYRGQIMVIDFWATWCGPCRLEGSVLEKVIKEFQDRPGLAFLAVNTDESRSTVPAFLKAEKWKIPVAYAQGFDRFMEVAALPTLLIFDREGRVVFRQEGLDETTFEKELEARLGAILANPAAPVSALAPGTPR